MVRRGGAGNWRRGHPGCRPALEDQAGAGADPGHGRGLSGASDPWAAFSANGRVLYVASLPFNNTNPDGTGGESAVAVSRSLDGGRHWGRPVLLDQQTSPLSQTDKESIATDPVKPRLAYSAWERLQIPPTLFPFRGPAMFSRTTDAGRTWEPARVLYDPGANALTINHQLFPRANGTLYDVFTTFRVTAPPPNPAFQNHLTVLVSPDRGATWGNPIFGPELLGAGHRSELGGATPHGQHTLGFPRSVRLGGDGLAHRHALRCLAGCPLQYRRVPSH